MKRLFFLLSMCVLFTIGISYLTGTNTIKASEKNEYQRLEVKSAENVAREKQVPIDIPFFGEANISNLSIYATTVIIAFVDGFNPCSLWLITFLLGIVIHSNSRKKILTVGGTFLLVTGAVYALFMAGLLNVFLYVSYLKWIQLIVAGVALIFAVVNIKDYFWYKKGVSFTISDKYKPKIFKNMRGIMNPKNTLPATIIGTVVLALGVVLIELPCTAGFPLIWTSMVAQQQIAGLTFAMLLGIYMLIYLLDEFIVVGGAFWTMKITRFEEKHGRILKLIGGMIMLALGLVMIIDPDLTNKISGAILIFITAIITSFLVMWFHRKILPRFGVHIGTEKDLTEKSLNNKENKEEN
jgi:cytochrome c biogenesis protein CcdA